MIPLWNTTIKLEPVECDVVVKCEFVKEEPEQEEWNSACVRVKEEASGQTECGVSAAARRAGLYANHQVKGELVLGPTTLQPPDALSAPPPSVSWEDAAWAGLDAGASRDQPRLRACSVRNEHLPPDAGTNSAILSTSAKRQSIKPRGPPASELCSCITCGEAPTGSVPNVAPDEKHSVPATPAAGARVRAGVPHQCPLYAKRFSSKTDLVVHEQIHRRVKPYECGICLKQYSRNSHLLNHVKKHTGETPYKCQICQKQFTRNINLVNHVKIHTGQTPHKCDICQKQFTQKWHLVDHVKCHTGKKPYKCNFCQKQFTRKSSFSRHMKIHTGGNKHICDICQKSFAQKISIIRHIRIHTGEKPYKCDICQQRFTQKSSLIRHIREKKGKNHTSVKKQLKRKKNLVDHVRSHTV